MVLDGAMGSMLQHCVCHGDSGKLPDLMVKEEPETVKAIHRAYLEAGADIIETDTFSSNSISLADYGLDKEAYTLSKEGAKLAKEVAEEYSRLTPGKPRFVAGSVGPTKTMLTLADEKTEINFDRLAQAYEEQIKGLLDGGADLILLETIFDTLTAKAAIYAFLKEIERRGEEIPLMISATVANETGRLLSGQTLEAFHTAIRHAEPLSIGINCGFGSEQVMPYLKRLDEVAESGISVYPNAGLPDECGEYHETATIFAKNIEKAMEEGLVNIVGGCCGTTPDHIRLLVETAARHKPRPQKKKERKLELSNLENSNLGESEELIQVGERTNVAGSAKFARLLREKKFDEALEIAAKQVRAGARMIDICMDDALEDSVANMEKFLRMVNSDPETGNVPVMIDSSDWTTIERGLKANPGKGVVNSISLKEGEEEFLRRAREIARLGGAMVIMLFDENGQAETYDRKIEIAGRAYRLLTENGIKPEDIIIDPNVLTVGSGMKEKDMVALDFIKATRWIKENLPGVSVSGGISNLSFAFRGNNPLREAMHTVFLYHASKAGLDMAIVNAGMLALYDEIEPQLLEKLEDLILCRKPNAVEALVAYAQKKAETEGNDTFETAVEKTVEKSLEEKIAGALLKGKGQEIGELTEEALRVNSPIDVIEKLLMPTMKKVGELFGEGKMFLPQVIKSAQAMKKAVSVLEPYLEKGSKPDEKNVIIATVKGDVHDIGKNIVGLVVSCNGYKVTDLGVRVSETEIADAVERIEPDAILLSGLIAPSLNEMEKVAEELEKRGKNIPIIIGGAATSEMHTAVKIAPKYSGPVYYSPDAAANLRILTQLSGASNAENQARQTILREKYKSALGDTGKDATDSKFPEEANREGTVKNETLKIHATPTPERIVYKSIPIGELESLIDWNYLLASLGLTDKAEEKERKQTIEDAKRILDKIKKEKTLTIEGVAGIFDAKAEGNDIIIATGEGERKILPMLRQETGEKESVADFIEPEGNPLILFAVRAGKGLAKTQQDLETRGENYDALLTKLVADRLAEAAALWIHKKMARKAWNSDQGETKGVRIAVGYPAIPDHTIKKDIFEMMRVEEETGMRLTENCMIEPGESVCGIIFENGKYFSVGKIGTRQLRAYSKKRGMRVEEMNKQLPNNTI